MWKYYALLSALFAALTAIFAKIGVKDINSDLATAIRTSIILIITWGIVLFGPHLGEIKDISRHTWVFLILSGIATGLSWLFYFKALQSGEVSRVAPIDKQGQSRQQQAPPRQRAERGMGSAAFCHVGPPYNNFGLTLYHTLAL